MASMSVPRWESDLEPTTEPTAVAKLVERSADDWGFDSADLSGSQTAVLLVDQLASHWAALWGHLTVTARVGTMADRRAVDSAGKLAKLMVPQMADSKVRQSGRSMVQSWAAMTALMTVESTEIDSVVARAAMTDSSMEVWSVAMSGAQKVGTTAYPWVEHLDCMWEYWTVAVTAVGMADHWGQRWVAQTVDRWVAK